MEWYAIRLTLDVSSDYHSILQRLQKISSTAVPSQVLVCYEVSKKKVDHNHAVVGTMYTIDALRKLIKKEFNVTNNTKEKISNGSENSMYSIKKVTDLNGACRYAMKDGNWTATHNFCPEAIMWAQNNPWEFPQETFQKSIDNLSKQYIDGILTDNDFLYDVLTVYAEHKRNLYLSHLRAFYLGLMNQRNAPIDDTTVPTAPFLNARWALVAQIRF